MKCRNCKKKIGFGEWFNHSGYCSICMLAKIRIWSEEYNKKEEQKEKLVKEMMKRIKNQKKETK